MIKPILISYVNPLYLDIYGSLESPGFDIGSGNGCYHFPY